MTTIARINDEQISAHDFVKLLKLNDKYDELIDEIMIDKLAVAAAKKQGVTVSIEEVQERADQFRRLLGLHRAKDTNEYLDDLGISLDEFEQYVVESLYKDKVQKAVCTQQAIEDYFSSNSPKFDAVDISHIVLDSQSKAREIMALLEDDPEGFEELVGDHSLDEETKDTGGAIGRVMRGTMEDEIEAKLFNASVGDIAGPFQSGDGLIYEIFKVTQRYPAKLNESTLKDVHNLVYDQWLEARAQEHRLEVL
ncbi:MAG: peptidylprolyl isomerase [Gammaproteobacteria bacterium]|nr:peptidylprolyl isomerase [Gammaproteobacteria bacterium]